MKTHQQRHRNQQRPAPLRAFKQREKRYPIWSAKIIVSLFLLGLLITALLVLLLGKRSLLVELEITLGIVATGLFLFLTVALYRGVRIKKREVITDDLKLYDGGNTEVGDLPMSFAGEADDPVGCIIGLLLGLLASLLFILLFIVFVNIAIVVFFLFMFALGWIFQRALRNVFAKSRRCRGDLLASLGYAGFYTFLYTGWLLLILLAVEWFRPK